MTSSNEKRPKKSSSSTPNPGTSSLTLANVREALFARRQKFSKPSETNSMMTPNTHPTNSNMNAYYSSSDGRPASYDARSRGRLVSQPFSNYNVANSDLNNHSNSSAPFDDEYARFPLPGVTPESDRKKRSDDNGRGGPPPRPHQVQQSPSPQQQLQQQLQLQSSPQTTSLRGSVSSMQNAMMMAGCNAPRRVSYYNGFLKDVVESDVGNYAAYMNYSTAPPASSAPNNNGDGMSSCGGGGERRRSSGGSYDGTARRSTAVLPLHGRRDTYDAQLAEAMVNTAEAAAAAQKEKERRHTSPRTSELRLSASGEGSRPSLLYNQGRLASLSYENSYNNNPQTAAAIAAALQLEETGSVADSVTLSVTNPKDGGDTWRRSPSAGPFGPNNNNNNNNMAALLQPNSEEALLLFSRNSIMNNTTNGFSPAAAMLAELPPPPRQTLSHKQLTEAFYGRYKGGDMAKDAYLHFLKGEDESSSKKRKSRKSSSLAATDGGGGGGNGRRSTTRASAAAVTDPYLNSQNGAATWGNNTTNSSLRNGSMSMFANWQWMQNSTSTSPSASPAQASLPNGNTNNSNNNNYNRDAAVAMFMNSYAPGTPNTAPAFDGRRNNSNSTNNNNNNNNTHITGEKKSVSFDDDSTRRKKEEKESPSKSNNNNNSTNSNNTSNSNSNKAEEKKKENVSAIKQNLQELLKKSKELYKTKTES